MTGPAGYLWNGDLAQRKTSPLCPESQQRYAVLAPEALFSEAGTRGTVIGFASRGAAILTSVHDPAYVEKVRGAHANGLRYLDSGETEVTPDVFPQALLSASAGCEAADRVMGGSLQRAFCTVRPPGHHANRYRALGFCVFNNCAVLADHLRRRHGIERVLIVDWDVHPGNGTQEIFWDDPQVFTFSIHQANHFPEAGKADLRGRGAGEGFNRNVPIPPGAGAQTYIEEFRGALEEVVTGFQPQFLIFAAGFDAHRSDPASSLGLDGEDFAILTRIALELTTPFTAGRAISLLEGGYSMSGLRDGAAHHFRVLCEGGAS